MRWSPPCTVISILSIQSECTLLHSQLFREVTHTQRDQIYFFKNIKPQRPHSSISQIKSSDLVPVGPRGSDLEWGRRELKPILLLKSTTCREENVHASFVFYKPQWIVAKSGSFLMILRKYFIEIIILRDFRVRPNRCENHVTKSALVVSRQRNLWFLWDGLLTHFYLTSRTSGTFSELPRGLRMPVCTMFSPCFPHSQGTSIFHFRDDPYGHDLADLSCCFRSRRAWTSRTVWAVPSVFFATTFRAVQSFSMFDVKTPTP